MGVLSLPPHFVWEEISRKDLAITCVAWGWTLGFGFLTGRNCWKQTSRMRNPLRSLYAWYIWLELVNCELQGLLFFLLHIGVLQPSFAIFFGLLVLWIFQTQCILQIICNRIALVDVNRRRVRWLKWTTIVVVAIINVSVFCLWIPARMQISHQWIHVNDIWDRIEKAIYLVLDLGLNAFFITTVKRKLVANGLTKYNRLVRFNQRIIIVSITMDALLLASMSFTSGTVYGQIHPVTYLIKLNIELALANLIVTIAREKRLNITLDTNEYAEGDEESPTRNDSYTDTILSASGDKCSCVALSNCRGHVEEVPEDDEEDMEDRRYVGRAESRMDSGSEGSLSVTVQRTVEVDITTLSRS